MPKLGTQYPNSALVGGNSVRTEILRDYVFASGIHDPEVSSILTYKYPQYYLTSLLDKLGHEESIAQNHWSWNTQGRTREGSTVLSVDSGGTGATAKITTNFDWTSASKGYLIVNDLIRLESGEIGRVVATGDSGATGGKQEVDIVRQVGGNWSAALLSATDAFGHVSSAFEEASSAPDGRLYLPTEDYNVLQTIRRSFAISGDEFTNRTFINNGESWYFEQENIEMKELAKDKETAILTGKYQATGNPTTRGILDWVESEGVFNGYATSSGVSEDDLQDQVKDLMKENVSADILCLCGADFLADAQKALADYQVQAEGKIAAATAGLHFSSYKFLGKTVHFAYYELFDDPSVFPTPVNGIDANSRANFSNYSLWLDMGSDDNGRSLISLKYKEHMGMSRKFIHTYEAGMMSPDGASGGMVSNGDDSFKINYLTQFGLEFRLANRCGILRATS